MAEEQVVRGIVERLAQIEQATTKLEAEQDMLWRQFYGLVDDTVGADQPYRWTHPTLKITIGRVIAENSPRLDEAALEKSLTEEQWRICTRQMRVFDMERLTKAVAEDQIQQADVQAATSQKSPTARKHFKPASKAELKELEEANLA